MFACARACLHVHVCVCVYECASTFATTSVQESLAFSLVAQLGQQPDQIGWALAVKVCMPYFVL